jgi:hypothetical protein
MTIIDDAMLDIFRHKTVCEWCNCRCTPHPHHWRARGRGSAWRLDVAFNLLSLCATCHTKAHAGNIPRDELLAVIAKREKRTAEWIRDAINLVLRLPYGEDWRKELEGMVAA